MGAMAAVESDPLPVDEGAGRRRGHPHRVVVVDHPRPPLGDAAGPVVEVNGVLFEYPGVRIDLVAREGFELFGREIEIKIEARNLTGQTNEEYQKAGENRIDVNSYKVGRSVAVSSSVKF
jgi:hypothetical protein